MDYYNDHYLSNKLSKRNNVDCTVSIYNFRNSKLFLNTVRIHFELSRRMGPLFRYQKNRLNWLASRIGGKNRRTEPKPAWHKYNVHVIVSFNYSRQTAIYLYRNLPVSHASPGGKRHERFVSSRGRVGLPRSITTASYLLTGRCVHKRISTTSAGAERPHF